MISLSASTGCLYSEKIESKQSDGENVLLVFERKVQEQENHSVFSSLIVKFFKSLEGINKKE
jgi:hypothetical protein